MAEVLLFHHALGRTAGILAFADELRSHGHTVHAPDLYDGRTFGSVGEGVDYARKIGFDAILERGVRAADGLPSAVVYAGFSLGVMPAQKLAQTAKEPVARCFSMPAYRCPSSVPRGRPRHQCKSMPWTTIPRSWTRATSRLLANSLARRRRPSSSFIPVISTCSRTPVCHRTSQSRRRCCGSGCSRFSKGFDGGRSLTRGRDFPDALPVHRCIAECLIGVEREIRDGCLLQSRHFDGQPSSCSAPACALALAAGLFGLGADKPAHHVIYNAAYYKGHGGIFGEMEFWAVAKLTGTIGADIVALALIAIGALQITGVPLVAMGEWIVSIPENLRTPRRDPRIQTAAGRAPRPVQLPIPRAGVRTRTPARAWSQSCAPRTLRRRR